MFENICSRVPWCRLEVLDPILDLAIEIAREGREGRRIGTLFTVGDASGVLRASRPLILDPLAGHVGDATRINSAGLRGTVKELAQLDGAFVIDRDGVVVAACRYLDAPAGGLDLPLGLGSRHIAGAAISRALDVIAVVVSESAVVRVFYQGVLIAEVLPELWLLSRHHLQLRGPVTEQHVRDLAIFTQDRNADREAEPSRGRRSQGPGRTRSHRPHRRRR
jgi:DNA integrity scanning protein DisA with diadenylate cyclase activity